jgi:hypothetical protein
MFLLKIREMKKTGVHVRGEVGEMNKKNTCPVEPRGLAMLVDW